ncbi:MAG: hypothetical protein LBB83_03955 [Treponema sp.]|jgi:hypothetical protein|nr:hypothetical protein [Treponema sp.]
MGGFIFRLGQRLKDWGECHKWNWLVRLGLGIRGFILRRGVIVSGKIRIG